MALVFFAPIVAGSIYKKRCPKIGHPYILYYKHAQALVSDA